MEKKIYNAPLADKCSMEIDTILAGSTYFAIDNDTSQITSGGSGDGSDAASKSYTWAGYEPWEDELWDDDLEW